MGLGGHLTWTAAARELYKHKKTDNLKVFPCKQHDSNFYPVESDIFLNNPYFHQGKLDGEKVFPLILNNPQTNYWTRESSASVEHKSDKHIIETLCAFYNIKHPELRCELYFTEEEEDAIAKLVPQLSDDFVVIEPHSKLSYTVNRQYPFGKWQKVVDAIKGEIQVVQVGREGSRVLDGAFDMTGKTSFREAAALIEYAQLLLSSEGGLVHAATAVNTRSIVVLTGYQALKMVQYPQNIYIDISSHGPCGLKTACGECLTDAAQHDYEEIVDQIEENIY